MTLPCLLSTNNRVVPQRAPTSSVNWWVHTHKNYTGWKICHILISNIHNQYYPFKYKTFVDLNRHLHGWKLLSSNIQWVGVKAMRTTLEAATEIVFETGKQCNLYTTKYFKLNKTILIKILTKYYARTNQHNLCNTGTHTTNQDFIQTIFVQPRFVQARF